MRWRQAFIDEVRQALVQLGWQRCAVCGSTDAVGVSPYPFPMVRGGLESHQDTDTNVEFFVKVECATCGHALFLNSERYRTGDEPVFETANS
jgi:hypothetical protein